MFSSGGGISFAKSEQSGLADFDRLGRSKSRYISPILVKRYNSQTYQYSQPAAALVAWHFVDSCFFLEPGAACTRT
jgi:hypothetical protein